MSEGKVEQWIADAAKELVEANADHGRTFDNSPDYLETARIIAAHAPSPSEKGWKRMKAEAYERGVRDAASASCVECQEEILALLQSNPYRS